GNVGQDDRAGGLAVALHDLLGRRGQAEAPPLVERMAGCWRRITPRGWTWRCGGDCATWR
ncbi:hypothetical protein, partial [Roseovarius sp. SYSU LYC5161]|uniref:hypothetical protein n=1 Tax=Roseovarius halophilus (ex Wu et al. 2025) TaxID=3376060 RepID=UPI00399A6AD9